jgi:GTP cyclohydrolase I
MLQELEEVPDRPGIASTPDRVARMWMDELTSGYGVDVDGLFKLFENEGYQGMVTMTDIPVTSVCEHHMVPIIGYAHVAYFPGDKGVVGLSKIARVVNAYARRLQVQERLTQQIVDAFDRNLEPRGCMVLIEAEHMCMTMRGVQAPGTKTITSTVTGLFLDEPECKTEFLRLIRKA